MIVIQAPGERKINVNKCTSSVIYNLNQLDDKININPGILRSFSLFTDRLFQGFIRTHTRDDPGAEIPDQIFEALCLVYQVSGRRLPSKPGSPRRPARPVQA